MITARPTSSAQFYALVPRLLGYQPEQSVVIVVFAGARSRGAMRFDIPTHENITEVASSMLGLALRVEGATGFAALVYTNETALEGIGLPILYALQERAEAADFPLRDGGVIASDGWIAMFEPELRVHELDEIRFGDEADLPPVQDGGVLAGTELPEVDDERRELVARKYEHILTAVGGFANGDSVEVDVDALGELFMLDELPAMFEQAIDGHPIEPARVAGLRFVLERPSLRDVGLMTWFGGLDMGARAYEAQLQWEQGVEYPVDLAQTIWGQGPQPDGPRLERALEVCRLVAAHMPSAGALAAAAWLSWALGRSTQADHYANQACAIEPEYGLAEIVLSFTRAGHLPDWAFTRKGQ